MNSRSELASSSGRFRSWSEVRRCCERKLNFGGCSVAGINWMVGPNCIMARLSVEDLKKKKSVLCYETIGMNWVLEPTFDEVV